MRCFAVVCVVSSALACAGRAPRPATPAREEIVDEEGSVVHAGPNAAASSGGELSMLPPLPTMTGAPSAALERSLSLGRELLSASPPAPAPDDQAGYDTWLKSELAPWLEARGRAVEAVLEPLAQVPGDVAAEQTVAAALVGSIYARTHDQLLAVPAPPAVRADSKLLRIYTDQVNQTSAAWVESAVAALRRCANLAAAQRDPSFVAWLDRCQAELARLEAQARDAQALAELVKADAAASEADPAPVEAPPAAPAPTAAPTAVTSPPP